MVGKNLSSKRLGKTDTPEYQNFKMRFCNQSVKYCSLLKDFSEWPFLLYWRFKNSLLFSMGKYRVGGRVRFYIEKIVIENEENI
jgi:hypothetical protein